MALHAPVLVMSMRFPPPPCAPPFLCLVFRLRDDVSLLLLGFSLGFFSPLVVRVDARLISLLGPAIRCVGSGFRVLLRLIWSLPFGFVRIFVWSLLWFDLSRGLDEAGVGRQGAPGQYPGCQGERFYDFFHPLCFGGRLVVWQCGSQFLRAGQDAALVWLVFCVSSSFLLLIAYYRSPHVLYGEKYPF